MAKNFKDIGSENIAVTSAGRKPITVIKPYEMVAFPKTKRDVSVGPVSMPYQVRKREQGAAGAEAVEKSRWKAVSTKKRLFLPALETDTIPRC